MALHSQEQFEHLPHNLAIVGNGPSELGQLSGPAIDRHEFVLRFNNFKCDESVAADYGTRTDIWGTQFFKDIVPPRPDGIQHVYCVYRFDEPFFYPARYDWKYPNHVRGFEDKTSFIPEHLFRELWSVVRYPTAGLSLLWWYWKEHGELRENSIFGFNFFDSTKRAHYWDPTSVDHCAHIHNSPLEKRVFEYMRRHLSTEVTMADVSGAL